MRNKFVFAILSIVLFVICFVAGVKIYDYSRREELKRNLQKISLGMSKNQVVEILGKPDHIWSSDEPSNYWCYDTDTISHSLEEQPDIECGNMTLQISYMINGERSESGRVIKIYEIK